MGARQDKRPVTKKTHLVKIEWIPGDVARTLVANNFPTLGALKKGLETAGPRGRILAIMRRNLPDVGDVEPLLARINAAPRKPALSEAEGERQPQLQP